MYLRLLFFLALFSPLCMVAQWTTQSTGFSDSATGLYTIWPVDNNVAWGIAYDASGNDSVIQKFTRTVNGGTTWGPGNISGATGFFPNSIFALNADTAWVSMFHPDNDGGRIMRTNDGGQTWVHQSSAVYSSATEAYPNLVYFWNANEGVCMGDPIDDYFEIYTTSDGGANWTHVDSTGLPKITSGDYGYEAEFTVVGDHLYFGTRRGMVYKTRDKGHHWVELTTPLASNNGRVRICEFRDTLNGIIADRANNVFSMYATADGGITWTALTPTGPVFGSDLHYVKGTWMTYISTGSASAVSGASISYDGGLNWVDISGTAGTPYEALGFANKSTGWAAQYTETSTVGGVAKFTGKTIGILEEKENQYLNLYPNPSSGRFAINSFSGQTATKVLIYDANGKIMYSDQNVSMPTTINAEHLPAGIYFIKLALDKQWFNERLVLVR